MPQAHAIVRVPAVKNPYLRSVQAKHQVHFAGGEDVLPRRGATRVAGRAHPDGLDETCKRWVGTLLHRAMGWFCRNLWSRAVGRCLPVYGCSTAGDCVPGGHLRLKPDHSRGQAASWTPACGQASEHQRRPRSWMASTIMLEPMAISRMSLATRTYLCPAGGAPSCTTTAFGTG